MNRIRSLRNAAAVLNGTAPNRRARQYLQLEHQQLENQNDRTQHDESLLMLINRIKPRSFSDNEDVMHQQLLYRKQEIQIR